VLAAVLALCISTHARLGPTAAVCQRNEAKVMRTAYADSQRAAVWLLMLQRRRDNFVMATRLICIQ